MHCNERTGKRNAILNCASRHFARIKYSVFEQVHVLSRLRVVSFSFGHFEQDFRVIFAAVLNDFPQRHTQGTFHYLFPYRVPEGFAYLVEGISTTWYNSFLNARFSAVHAIEKLVIQVLHGFLSRCAYIDDSYLMFEPGDSLFYKVVRVRVGFFGEFLLEFFDLLGYFALPISDLGLFGVAGDFFRFS